MNPRYATWRAAILPRESLDGSCHAQIDLSLKDLRAVSRRLAAFATPYSDELQVLERIYYKGKNQHRSALFWRKVVEIRRLGARIIEMNIPDLVEGLRYSCYGDEGRINSKSMRGAWKYTPNINTCKSILKRLRSACFLVDRARRQFCLAYRTFTRQLRTAAFLPLIVSLVAITSRLKFLLGDLRSSIVSYWEAVMRMLEAITLPAGLKLERSALLLPADVESDTARSTRRRKRGKPCTVNPKAEDLGDKVPRDVVEGLELKTAAPASSTEVEFNPSIVHFGEHPPNSLFVPPVPPFAEECSYQDMDDMATLLGATAPKGNASGVSHALHPPIWSIRAEDEGTDASGKVPAARKKKRKAVNRKKRDEIDDIFGF